MYLVLDSPPDLSSVCPLYHDTLDTDHQCNVFFVVDLVSFSFVLLSHGIFFLLHLKSEFRSPFPQL